MEKKDAKILIVEDDIMLNKIYQTKLTLLGYQVLAAYDGDEGLTMMGEHQPHLVLLDLMLPKKNGFEVLEAAKQDVKISRIPVIILSNLGQGGDIQKGMELGAVDFLVKSNVKLEAVVDKIGIVLQKYYG
ncbi:response regulator [Candidatus Azambacteria bacterium]|nr:response regulator [Candidatus Azambacteria bacterium]